MNKTIKEVKEWLLENRTDEFGNLNLVGLDFSDFNGNVSIGRMKVKNYLFQHGQNVEGVLYQNKQKVKGSINQDYQEVGGNLYQDSQEVEGTLYQDNQSVKGDLYQDEPKTYTIKEIEALLGYKINIKE